MSQVRKLQPGGTVSNDKKYTIQLDGQTFTINEDQLSQINNAIANLDMKYKRYLGGVSKAIQDGSFIGNRAENTISLNALSNLSDKELNFLANKKKTRWEAISEAPTYQAKEAINEALRIVNNAVNNTHKKSSSNSTKTIGSNDIVLDFNTDENSGISYLSPYADSNYQAKNRVTQILNHIKAGDASEYTVDGWDTLDSIKSWINGLEGEDKYKTAQDAFDELWGNMGNKTKQFVLGPDTEDILRLFKINSKTSSSNSDVDASKAKLKKEFEAAFPDNKGLYDLIGEYVEKGSDGVWRLKPGTQFNFGIELNPNQGIEFNDDYFDYIGDESMLPLKGLTFYKGGLYNRYDPKLKNILERPGGYNELMRRGNWAGAQNIVKTIFNPDHQFTYGKMPDNAYSEWFYTHPNYRFKNLTGEYEWDNMGNNQLVEYVDLDSPDLDTGSPYLTYTPQRVIFNNNGEYVGDYFGNYTRIPDAKAKAFNTAYSRVVDAEDSPYQGMYYMPYETADGKQGPVQIYRSPDKENKKIILHFPGIKAAGVGNADLYLPEEIAQYIVNDKNLINTLASNPRAFQKFRDVMSRTVQSGIRGRHKRNPITYPIDLMILRAEVNNLKKIGVDSEGLLNAIEKYVRDHDQEHRQNEVLVYPPVTMNKLGGKVDYIKKLSAGGSNEVSVGTTKLNRKLKHVSDANAPINPGQFTREDWDDVAALVADLASTGIMFADPTNIGGAAAGAAASFARFKADMGRHRMDPNEGKGAGWNLALNLGMDAIGLVPILGDAVSAAKSVQAIRKSLPTVMRLVAAAGIGDAAYTSLRKIANNEKWTVRDVSVVLNAITAGAAAYRLGGFGKQAKTVKGTKLTAEKVKIGENEKELSEKAIERILKSSNQEEQTIKELKKMFSDASEEALENAASELLVRKKSLWDNIRKKDGKLVLDANKVPNNKTTPIEAESEFGKWHRRQGDDRAAYLAELRGEKATKSEARKGTMWTREDVAEAPGTTAGGKYYKDEFGTSYRRGEVSKKPITAEEYKALEKARQAEHGNVGGKKLRGKIRTPINDDAGNFTGRVRVSADRPFAYDTNGRPIFTEAVPLVNKWNIQAPNILAFWHTRSSGHEYPEQYVYKKGGVIKAQGGTTVRRIIDLGGGNYKEDTYQYDGNLTDEQIYQLLPQEDTLYPVVQSDGTVVYQAVVPQYEITRTDGPTLTVATSPEENVEQEIVPETEAIEEETPIGVGRKISKASKDKVDKFSFKPYSFFAKAAPVDNNLLNGVPLSKQKVIRIKTNKKKDIDDLIEVLEGLSNNNVVKGQNGLYGKWLDDAKKHKITVTSNNPYQSNIPELPSWFMSTTVGDGHPFEYTPTISGTLGLPDFTLGQEQGQEQEQKPNTGGGDTYNISDVSKYVLPGISLAGYAYNRWLQKKYRDTDKKRIEAGRFHETPVWLNTGRTDNPILDRAARDIQSQLMIGSKPVTSNVILNNAIKQQRDAQLYEQQRNIIGQQSQAQVQADRESLNITNQNIANATTAANQNAARDAAINSALYNPDLEYLQRKGASADNLRREIQTNLTKDREVMLKYNRHMNTQRVNRDYDIAIDELFPGARAEYNNLNATDSAKYYDFEHYLRVKYPDKWNEHREDVKKAQETRDQALLDWEADNALSGYSRRSWYGKQSTVGVARKGGRINGTTRYTLEPDERIWIDNNKAAHKAIGKLSDSTIKLLLRALK